MNLRNTIQKWQKSYWAWCKRNVAKAKQDQAQMKKEVASKKVSRQVNKQNIAQGLGVLIWLGLIIWGGLIWLLLGIAAIAVWYIWKKSKIKIIAKALGTVAIISISLVIGGMLASSSTDSTTSPADGQTAEQSEQSDGYTQEQKDLILAFESQVYAIEDKYKPIMTSYSNVMTKLGNGTANIFDAYSATTKAQQAVEAISSEYSDLKPSSKLPKDIRNKLSEASSELSTAYYIKTRAFKAIKQFLDNQKPSDFQKAQDEIKLADQFIYSAISKILEVKLMAGIDL